MQHSQASQAEAIGSGQMGTCTPLLALPWAWLGGLPACWGLARAWLCVEKSQGWAGSVQRVVGGLQQMDLVVC